MIDFRHGLKLRLNNLGYTKTMTGKCLENLRNLLHAVMLLMWLSAMQPVM